MRRRWWAVVLIPAMEYVLASIPYIEGNPWVIPARTLALYLSTNSGDDLRRTSHAKPPNPGVKLIRFGGHLNIVQRRCPMSNKPLSYAPEYRVMLANGRGLPRRRHAGASPRALGVLDGRGEGRALIDRRGSVAP